MLTIATRRLGSSLALKNAFHRRLSIRCCKKKFQVENSLVIFFYPFIQILFDGSQGHVDLLIHLNLVVLFIKHLGKLVKGIVRVVFTKLSPQAEAMSCNVIGNTRFLYLLG